MTALYEETLDFRDTTEVHWSTGTILAVFFAASLISAVFFGLGYSFGGAENSKSAVAATTAPASTQPTASTANFFQKLSSHAASSSGVIAVPHAAAVASHQASVTQTVHPAAMSGSRAATPVSPTTHVHTTVSEVSKVRTMVQVGAIGNRKDAERLVAQLRKKGFYAGIYRGKNDKFLHVQIGPYADEQQAQSTRHHLTASGYHAILKSAS